MPTSVTIPTPRTADGSIAHPPDIRLLSCARERSWFLIALSASLLLRLIAMAMTPLIPEEAYYWMYARHPSLSYFDHPAMVAWFIQLGTWMFGNTQFGVRIASDLAMLGASALMYGFARLWWGRREAVWAAVSLQILPVYFGVGFMGMMDSALILWWLVCLLGFSLAVRKNRISGWYLCGIGFGLAMQSKYSAIFLLPGIGLCLLLHRPYRGHLKSIHPWIALMVGIALFTPTILWNAQHDWASFQFQFVGRSTDEPANAGTILTFILFQLAILTPTILVGAWLAGIRLIRRRGIGLRRVWPPGWIMAAAFCLPLTALLGWKSIRESHLNWTLPAWLSLLPALAHLLHARLRLARRSHAGGFDWHRSLRTTVWICIVINVAVLSFMAMIHPLTGGVEALGPWRSLAQAVQKQVSQFEAETGHPVLLIADGKYRMASLLAFYRLPDDPSAIQNTTSQWVLWGEGLGYEYWTNLKQWVGGNCIYVTERPDDLAVLPQWFDRVVVAPEIRVPLHPPYAIALCYGFHPAKAH